MDTLSFDCYAAYYNCLYQDKNYAEEAEFVLALLQAYGAFSQAADAATTLSVKKTGHPEKQSEFARLSGADDVRGTLLELGCGTGGHAFEMARVGYVVQGVDLSPQMIRMAQFVPFTEQNSGCPAPEFIAGDARSVRLGRHFDAVVSLFHVMSYQTDEKDLLAVLETAKAHLLPGGFFLFDFWHGPAVLKDRPGPREKHMSNDSVHVTRVAQPQLELDKNIVHVDFSVSVQTKATGETSSIFERHSMRYWFLPELRFLAKCAGLELLYSGAWMQHSLPTDDDWYAWVLLRA